jgi:hypothetical protein
MEDPAYPDVAAGAAVVWQQNDLAVATDLDIYGSMLPWVTEDDDGDGVNNLADNCVAISNGGQADADQDGYGDACDICPGGNDSLDSDADGIPDACDEEGDTDNDGDVDGSDVGTWPTKVLSNLAEYAANFGKVFTQSK